MVRNDFFQATWRTSLSSRAKMIGPGKPIAIFRKLMRIEFHSTW